MFGIDLVRDGPHGLVGGTTGSGKSEFLRSMVAGLAARNDPTRLTFILIDFKGGAAFKTCERLPHTIGTVSNLDEQLADRALTRPRGRAALPPGGVRRGAGEGVDNLDAYLATNPEVPMPRLLLVIDEFAMLAKDYPDVLKSLVSVAAVGRTLGVHMILATQRPAGVVNEDILANTNLRVALRVQSRDDSTNVIGVPAAAAIGRTQWGRAYVKLGQDDISPGADGAGHRPRRGADVASSSTCTRCTSAQDVQRDSGTPARDDDADRPRPAHRRDRRGQRRARLRRRRARCGPRPSGERVALDASPARSRAAGPARPPAGSRVRWSPFARRRRPAPPAASCPSAGTSTAATC